MYSVICSTHEFELLAQDVAARVKDHIIVQYDHLRQGLSAGFGFKSHAALAAAVKSSKMVSARRIDHLALIQRLQSLGNNYETAETVSAIIDGRRLIFTLNKQLNHPAYGHTSYYLEVNVFDQFRRRVAEPFFFIMPLFETPKGVPYQVDSAAHYRHSSAFSVSRHPNGRGLLTVEGADGRWFGGLYIYEARHQQDDRNCKKNVAAALARRILPAVSPRFNCQLYKPDGYQQEAWKLRISLGDLANEQLKGWPLVSVRRTHLPNSSIKGDGVRVFLSGRDHPYRQDFHAPTKLLSETIQSPGCSGMPATWRNRVQCRHQSRHQRQRHPQMAAALSRPARSNLFASICPAKSRT